MVLRQHMNPSEKNLKNDFLCFCDPKCHRKEQHKTSKFLKCPGGDPEALTERGDPPLPTRSLHHVGSAQLWGHPL